jgi:hypothetical protein
VAKKKKGTRAGASKKASKRAAPRRSTRAAKPAVHRGLAQAGKVNFKFLKKDIDDHIDRLRGMDQNDTRVAEALTALNQARTALQNPCSPTMVIP